jgi:DNA invertase Pin-like site-specific DNA recombinase
MEKAVIYLRVSTEKQTEESQLEPCKKLCEEKGWEIIAPPFKDHGISAYKNSYRPQYNEVCNLVRAKKIQHIVVWALDRWTRKGPKELQHAFEFLSENGVQLHSIHELFLDNLNIPGNWGYVIRQTVIGLLGTMAEAESQLKSERVLISEKFQKSIKDGTVGRQPIPQDAELKIAELLKQGKKWKEIREQVTYKTKYGKEHHVTDSVINRIKKSVSTF